MDHCLSTDPAFPLQQGQLDWLCSLYAIINALHIKFPQAIHYEIARAAFRKVTLAVQAQGTLAALIGYGIDPDPDEFEWLADCAIKSLGTPTKCCKFTRVKEMPADAICLVFLEGPSGQPDPFSHYTVVTTLDGPGKLTLADSDGYDALDQADGKFVLWSSKFGDQRQTSLGMGYIWQLQ